MANGRVITGFSKPYVATYAVSGSTVSYTGVTPLARGVSVQVSPTTGEDQNFYADNVLAESAGGIFTGGEVTLTVDGLKDAARKLIMGTTTQKTVTPSGGSTTVKLDVYDDDQVVPYVGIGFVVRYQESGTVTYVPVVLTKCSFNQDGLDASTQGETVEFQTQELTAVIMRDDSAKHAWKMIGEAQDTEAKAVAVLQAVLA